jgi:hypothetical protein
VALKGFKAFASEDERRRAGDHDDADDAIAQLSSSSIIEAVLQEAGKAEGIVRTL